MKRLVLNKKDATIAGVCAGLGDYFDLDPIVFKLAFIFGFCTPCFPAGIIYLILAIIVPDGDKI